MNINEVNTIANAAIRKYDWNTQVIARGVKLTVNDGSKYASVEITTGENIQDEIKRVVAAVDAHEYGDLDG